MHLVFLYVKQYQMLHNIGFNFDLNCSFCYHGGRLELLRRGSLVPENFFSVFPGQNSIECVSAIVGSNGTGKTSVSKLLKEMVLGRQYGAEYIAVFAEDAKNNRFDVYYNLDLSAGEELRIENLEPSAYKLHSGSDELAQCLSVIYYSPNFTTEFGFDGPMVSPRSAGWVQCDSINSYAVVDASVTACIRSALDEGASRNPFVSIVMCERRRVLTFLQDIASNGDLETALNLPFNLAKNAAYVRFDDQLLESLSDICSQSPGQSFEGDSRFQYLEEDDPPTWRERFIEAYKALRNHSFFKILLCCICIRLLDSSSYEGGDIGKMTSVATALFDILKSLEEISVTTEGVELEIIDKLRQFRAEDWGDDTLAELEELADFLEAIKEYQRAFCDIDVPLQLSDRDDVKINAYLRLMETYLRVRRNQDFISFGFRLPFSSGEMAYISMWARMYDAIQSVSVGQSAARKNLLVLVDEAETAFHPEWQRELVKRTIAFFGVIAKGFQVHMLFNTHSPIILSDVPSGNAVFLRRGNDGTVLADQGNDRRTFAANIFDLFRDSFFMEKGTVGAFAQDKIDKALLKVFKKAAQDGGEQTENIDESDKAVSRLIGDGKVRSYLQGWINALEAEC